MCKGLWVGCGQASPYMPVVYAYNSYIQTYMAYFRSKDIRVEGGGYIFEIRKSDRGYRKRVALSATRKL